MDTKATEALFNRVIGLEERKKDIATDIKDEIDGFCQKYSKDPKHVKEALKKYKKFLKDGDKFAEEDHEIDAMLVGVIPNYGE